MHIMCSYISFWFLFCFDFSKVTVKVSFYVSFSCLYLILCAFCDAFAGEEMQTQRPSAAIAVMVFRISSRDTIFFCFMRRNLFQ